MHRRFKAWVDAKRRSRQHGTRETQETSEPEMPYLPNPRPYALTPPPSQQQVTTLAETPPIFRLPLELRREILINAFGDRTVHIDLVLTHPLRDPSDNPSKIDPKRRWVSPMHLYPYTKENLGLDKRQPKYWQWRGCVCHRLPPPWMVKDLKVDLVDYHNFYKPGDDECCDGTAVLCAWYTKFPKKPDTCWIGVMGWLLTCRQAYVDGIEVLYGTNIIHLSSKPLLTNLTKFIRPRSLALITSLEIVWCLDTHDHEGKACPNVQQLQEGLILIDQHFPCLRSLHLGLRLDIPNLIIHAYRIRRAPAYLSDMLQHIDGFIKRRNELPEVDRLWEPLVLSISESAYAGFKKEVRGDDQHFLRKSRQRLWRALAPGPFVQDEEGGIIDARPSDGYWVCGDYQDTTIIRNTQIIKEN